MRCGQVVCEGFDQNGLSWLGDVGLNMLQIIFTFRAIKKNSHLVQEAPVTAS